MKKFIAAILLCALSVLPFSRPAAATPDYEGLVRWAGCKNADVSLDPSLQIIESYYIRYRVAQEIRDMTGKDMQPTVVLGTKGYAPEAVQYMVVFHETGHCLQDEAGYIDKLPVVVIELDADRLAADLACGYHLDGRQMLHDAFVWMYETFGYDGDPWHGTLKQRIEQGNKAARCNS